MCSTKITSENLEKMFDRGEDVTEFFDFDAAAVEDRTETRRVNVDFPAWVVEALDREARRIGIGRQAVIKTWIAERLDEETSRRSA